MTNWGEEAEKVETFQDAVSLINNITPKGHGIDVEITDDGEYIVSFQLINYAVRTYDKHAAMGTINAFMAGFTAGMKRVNDEFEGE